MPACASGVSPISLSFLPTSTNFILSKIAEARWWPGIEMECLYRSGLQAMGDLVVARVGRLMYTFGSLVFADGLIK